MDFINKNKLSTDSNTIDLFYSFTVNYLSHKQYTYINMITLLDNSGNNFQEYLNFIPFKII